MKLVCLAVIILLNCLPAFAGTFTGEEVSNKSVSETLANSKDKNYEWVKATMGRVLKVGGASGAIWSVKGSHAIVLTAFHVVPISPTDSQQGAPEFLADSSTLKKFPLSQVYLTKDGNPFDEALPTSRLYSLAVDKKITDEHLRRIGPDVDGVVAILEMGSEKVEDPQNKTKSDDKIFVPQVGDLAISFGYIGSPAKLTYSVGRILNPSEAPKLLGGSDEADVPFNPQGEFILTAAGKPGFSGGATFDTDGNLIGTVSRGGTTKDGKFKFLRMNKTLNLLQKLNNRISALPNEQKSFLSQYFSLSNKEACKGSLNQF